MYPKWFEFFGISTAKTHTIVTGAHLKHITDPLNASCRIHSIDTCTNTHRHTPDTVHTRMHIILQYRPFAFIVITHTRINTNANTVFCSTHTYHKHLKPKLLSMGAIFVVDIFSN